MASTAQLLSECTPSGCIAGRWSVGAACNAASKSNAARECCASSILAAAVISAATAAAVATAAAQTVAAAEATDNQHFNSWFVIVVAIGYVAGCYVCVAARFCRGLVCATAVASFLVADAAAAANLNAAVVVFICGAFATDNCCYRGQ